MDVIGGPSLVLDADTLAGLFASVRRTWNLCVSRDLFVDVGLLAPAVGGVHWYAFSYLQETRCFRPSTHK